MDALRRFLGLERPLKSEPLPPTAAAAGAESSVDEITRSDIHLEKRPDALAFVLYNVFTPEECQKLIDMSEAKGYSPALVNVGGGQQVRVDDYRNNERCMIDDEVLAASFFDRLRRYIRR